MQQYVLYAYILHNYKYAKYAYLYCICKNIHFGGQFAYFHEINIYVHFFDHALPQITKHLLLSASNASSESYATLAPDWRWGHWHREGALGFLPGYTKSVTEIGLD